MASKEFRMLRDAVAKEYGFKLFGRYSEEQAASLLGKDLSTIKRLRRAKKLHPIKNGERGYRYWGIYIADLLLLGEGAKPPSIGDDDAHDEAAE